MRKRVQTLVAALLLMSQASAQELNLESFRNPAPEYKPATWMHAMSANMSKAGLTKDLESIKSVGIGGVLLFNISQKIPYGDVKYASDEHVEMMRHAAMECERLGLTFGFHNCDGWSSSGGPWITPEQSMKMLVYRQVVTKGGRVNMKLPQPSKRRGYYEDIKVLAYPATNGDIADAAATIVDLKASNSNFDKSVILDQRSEDRAMLSAGKGEKPSIIIDYGKAEEMRSVITTSSFLTKSVDLYASDDGVNFTYVTPLKKYRHAKMEAYYVANFEPVNKRYYKVEYNAATAVRELRLSHDKLFEGYLAKSVMGRVEDEAISNVAPDEEFSTINTDQVIDLSDYMDEKGVLKAKLPKGKWTIMRIGCTTTEAFNHPASDDGRGLECDKFSKEAIEAHFAAFVQRVVDSSKGVAPNALQYVEIDSFEMGGQNWSEDLPEEFERRKGYSMMDYLPLLLGKCINSNDESDAMLSDFRDVCCDLMSENYFDHFGELCHQNGLKYYIEPYGNGAIKSLDITKNCDIPMGEFWMDKKNVIGKGGISGAHIYGKKVISAESFTSGPDINWKGHPALAKAAGDMAWKEGVNEFMFHRFAHQANTHVMPGMTMGSWGFHFDRTQTWWESAGKDWFKYMARGSYMLRQGVPVSDMLVFVGEGSPATGVRGDYGSLKYDFVNEDVLINRTKLVDNKIVLPEGTTYRILALRNSKKMSMSTLRRLAAIVEAGVPVIGDLPTSLMGMKNLTEPKAEMERLVAQIKSAPNYYETVDYLDVYSQLNITPDFEVTNRDEKIDFFHRHIADNGGAEIYFISNPNSERVTYDCGFRVTGKLPEIWCAMSGKSRKVEKWSMSSSQTSAAITLDPLESAFVVFKDNTNEQSFSEQLTPELIAAEDLSCDWSVEFQKFYGYDQTLQFDKVIDWSKSDNDEVKYYSGTATYRKDIDVESSLLETSDQVILDLGDVKIVAEIIVNGKQVCVDWFAPFTNDIREYLHEGKNSIELRVTNQWTNRLIGDERYPVQNGGFEHDPNNNPVSKMPRWYVENQPMPEGPRITFTTWPFYDKESELIPAGLVGPVELQYVRLSNR